MTQFNKHDHGLAMPRGMVGSRPFDFDRMGMLPRAEVAHAALLTMHQLQVREDPEEIVLGIATCFAAICQRARVDPAEVYAMAVKVLDAEGDGDHVTSNALQSLKDFVAGKVLATEIEIG